MRRFGVLHSISGFNDGPEPSSELAGDHADIGVTPVGIADLWSYLSVFDSGMDFFSWGLERSLRVRVHTGHCPAKATGTAGRRFGGVTASTTFEI